MKDAQPSSRLRRIRGAVRNTKGRRVPRLQFGSDHYKPEHFIQIRRNAAIAVVLAILLATSSWAQREERESRFPGLSAGATLGGVVTAGEEPAPGISVEVQSLSTGEVVRAYTSDDGSFSVGNLPAGEYLLTAGIGADQAQTQVSLSFGPSDVHLRLPGHPLQGAAGATVSAQQLLVPKKARSILDDAKDAVQHGDLQRATAQLEKALAIAPKFAEALALRATLYLHVGDARGAVEAARAAVRSDSNSPQAYFVLAAALNQIFAPDDAAQAAQQGLRLNPRSWQGHFELGRAMVQQNQNEKAVKELTTAVQSVPPHFGGVHLVRGFALMQLQRYGDAEKDLHEAVERDPNGRAAVAAQQLLQRMEEGFSFGP